MTDAEETAPLVDALHVWRVDPRGQVEELLEAVRLVARSNPDLAAVRELAGASGMESYGATRALVDAVAAELDVPVLEGAELQDAAVAAMARRHLAGQLSARELTYWVTRVVGLRATARSHVFLTLEEEYVAHPWGEEERTALDARVEQAAASFVHGTPDDDGARRGLVARLQSWRTRGR